MPRIICARCQIAYKPAKNGVYLIEMAWNPEEPYKIWHSDLWECPKCKHSVISGFGNNALAEHYQDNFTEVLNTVLNTGDYFYEYENQ